MKKVLIAASIYPPDPGGPATHAKAQFEGLPKFGVETGLVALAHYRHWPFGVRHTLFFFSLLLRVSRYDLVYAHDAFGVGVPAFLAAKILGKKFVMRIGGDLAWEKRAEKTDISVREWYEAGKYRGDKVFIFSRFLMRHSDRVILISDFLVDIYTRYYGLEREKFEVILNPVPVSTPTPSTEQTIIFASRLTAYKNLGLPIRALVKVFSAHPDLKFLIMGTGPEMDSLKQLVQELKVESNVILDGHSHKDEVSVATSRCLFTIAPALTEFNPNYVLEGIGFGKPFLISREHGLPFAVPEKFVFDPHNEAELTEKILNLLTPDGYAEAQNFVQNLDFHMTWEENLEANLKLINQVIMGQ